MANPTKRPDGVLSASSIQPDLCEHGTLTLHLFDPDGQVFAVAVMPIDQALEFSLDVAGQLNELGERLGVISSSEQVH